MTIMYVPFKGNTLFWHLASDQSAGWVRYTLAEKYPGAEAAALFDGIKEVECKTTKVYPLNPKDEASQKKKTTEQILALTSLVADPDGFIPDACSSHMATIMAQAVEDGMADAVDGGWKLRGELKPGERRIFRNGAGEEREL